MKKRIILLANIFLFLGLITVEAQNQQECTIKYNLFKGDYQSKKYDAAYPNWIYLMDNCQKLSINIYKYGDKFARCAYPRTSWTTSVVAGGSKGEQSRACTPCGGCRQRIDEFADGNTRVIVKDDDENWHSYSMSELLPSSFHL